MSKKGLWMSNSLIRILIILLVLILYYLLALVIGFDFTILRDKVPLVWLVRLLFIWLFSQEVPLIIIICLLSGLDEFTFHMMDQAKGQPTANPWAEQPSDNASTSGWISFEEGVLLQFMPSSNKSIEVSGNQHPVTPELGPPLLDDNNRQEEPVSHLRVNW